MSNFDDEFNDFNVKVCVHVHFCAVCLDLFGSLCVGYGNSTTVGELQVAQSVGDMSGRGFNRWCKNTIDYFYSAFCILYTFWKHFSALPTFPYSLRSDLCCAVNFLPHHLLYLNELSDLRMAFGLQTPEQLKIINDWAW